MDLSENCAFKHNFDLVFPTLITLIIFALIVLVRLTLPLAILLVRHAFRIAISTARIMILPVRRVRMLARGAYVTETWTFGGSFLELRA